MLIIKKHNMAIKKDEENKLLLAYDFKDNEIQEHTEGILKEVNQEIGDAIQQYFNVNLTDYGLIVINEDELTMSM
ncbi:hypothetical protein [Sulfurimonas sp.]|uniref:hypothetical protein n=1 Tax=Sulfurimonas sp. TaxID=2022749 RepID=UPI0025D26DC8|nr:hypothetical protein [Sulfurimonas sp.]MBW6487519.1 hypothetical protein [Sulfurimonas sp.]